MASSAGPAGDFDVLSSPSPSQSRAPASVKVPLLRQRSGRGEDAPESPGRDEVSNHVGPKTSQAQAVANAVNAMVGEGCHHSLRVCVRVNHRVLSPVLQVGPILLAVPYAFKLVGWSALPLILGMAIVFSYTACVTQ